MYRLRKVELGQGMEGKLYKWWKELLGLKSDVKCLKPAFFLISNMGNSTGFIKISE